MDDCTVQQTVYILTGAQHFEEVDLKLSYELASWFRFYGSGGMLVGRDPNDLQRGTDQMGAELISPWTLWDGKVRPVAHADVQANARSNWRVGSSVMAGLQFENARIGDRKIQVLAEYFGGPSPNGQFYTQHTEWFGIGAHLYILIHRQWTQIVANSLFVF